MKRLLCSFAAIALCAVFTGMFGNFGRAALAADTSASLGGVWSGYAFSLSGSQSRVYAVFSKNPAGGTAVQLFSPATPWASDQEALCSLRGADCGRPVDFNNLSSRLQLEYRKPFYSNADTSESGQIIKLSPEGGRLKFTFRKGGYALEQQEISGYLDVVAN